MLSLISFSNISLPVNTILNIKLAVINTLLDMSNNKKNLCFVCKTAFMIFQVQSVSHGLLQS